MQVCLFIDILVNMNTGYFDKGLSVKERDKTYKFYVKN